MSTNISKKKRDDLLDKIKQIRAFIAAAPQDENTGNLLSYLSELEKDVNGKKYGLVFEEHREEIDEVLDTHTPVLTEDADLFIDHGGQMNFLIEGDNLASLQLLEKTHKGKIDLIYIDPPYNTGAKDFVYDDAFVDTTDGFNHSKWLSFMKQRLSLSKKLLAAHGTIFISIDDKFDQCVDDGITKDAGEYVVSELARETMISKLDYLDIPLAELVGKKRSGNPGFDFHSQNKTTDTVIFGEAKYVTATTAYSSALPQIVDFIGDEKDVEDLPELKPFCTTSALQRAANGLKGFSAAFSAKTTSTDRIIANIKKRSDFQALLQYEELILVAVDL